jgi:hypothetical protein
MNIKDIIPLIVYITSIYILNILAMLANLKRLFSGAKMLIIDLRNRLGIDIIKAFKCLKS